jgi:hypothetical protein
MIFGKDKPNREVAVPSTHENKGEAGTKPSRAPYVSGIVVLACYLSFIGASFFWEGWIDDMLRNHYVFFVGVPFAGLTAHFLVGTLENTRGKIEFEVVGMKFRGASGPIIMWVLVFLAIVVASRLVWGLSP